MIEGRGWWIDLQSGEAIPIDEHAFAVMRDPQRFRIEPNEVKGKMEALHLAMKRGFVRIREHGSVVVEFDHSKLEDIAAVVIPFLTSEFQPNTWVLFNDIARKKQYADVKIQNLEDPDYVSQMFGLVYEHKGWKLSALYEDYDQTPVGSRKYATGTEKLVRGPASGAGAGVQPPESGDISRISDVGSEPYTKDSVGPSERPKKGRSGSHPSLRRPLGR